MPGVFPPVTINGRRYMDGGMRSTTNADLAEGYERVLVVPVTTAARSVGRRGDATGQDLAIAEGQLRDYEARLGSPFPHDAYLTELTQLRDQLKAGLAHTIANRDSATDGARRPIEGGEKTIASRRDLLPAEVRELASHRGVMLFEYVAPGTVAE